MTVQYILDAVIIVILLYLVCRKFVGDDIVFEVNRNRKRLEKVIMTAAQDAVDAVTAQLTKAKGEIVAEIDSLEGQVLAGQAPDFTALRAAAQGLDDVVPDAPAVPAPDDTAGVGDGSVPAAPATDSSGDATPTADPVA